MRTPTLNLDLVKALRALRLGPIADSLPDRLVLAEEQQMSFEHVFLLRGPFRELALRRAKYVPR
jgi:hypothetical protein